MRLGLTLLFAVSSLGAGLGCEREPQPRTAIPHARLPRVSAMPTIDGRLDEAVWERATQTATFVNTMSGASAAFEATARLAWTETHLLVAFSVEDDFLKCTFDGHDAHLWEQDVVEVMIDPNGDGRDYFELQLSPTGLVFDTRFDTRRQPQPFGHVAWSSDLDGAVDARGTPNDDGRDRGYRAEMAIPFAALERGHPSGAAPRPGDTWRLALYVLDARRSGQRAAGWSPPLVGDFHVLERFGRITFQ